MNFNNPSVVWFVVGFVLMLLEFVMPGLILFFFAVGAWIVALLTLFFNLSINSQLISFIISSVLSIVFLRKWMSKLLWTRKASNEIEDELIGKNAIAESSFGPDENGKVEFRGISWGAQSDDQIIKGETVIIVGNDSITLIVKSKKATQ